MIDLEQSTVRSGPNIEWRDEPLRERLSERLPGIRISVDNDANAAGWGEFRFGAGRGVQDMTLLTVGTGVGGAVVTGGRLIRGGLGAAGEFGHLRLVPQGRPWGCGQYGCLEQYGSGRALLRMAGEIADAGGIAHFPARGYRPAPGFTIAELRNDADAVGAADLARRPVGPLVGRG